MRSLSILILAIISVSVFLKEPEKIEGRKNPIVYFTKNITSEAIVRMYNLSKVELKGKVALKVHSGEKGGKYFLTPEFLEEIKNHTKGTFVECNTAYENMRHNTTIHKQLLKEHHWDKAGLVIMDEDPDKDIEIKIPNGKEIKKNYVGQHFTEYDSLLVLSHVKGHRMGGFGGALKQLSIGFGSQRGKTYIHTCGNQTDWHHIWTHTCPQENFTSAMADAAWSVVNYFNERFMGGSFFINVIANISLRCDCEGGEAPEPKIKDIGILASTDPVAIDMASLNLIGEYADDDDGKKEWFDQLRDLLGNHTIEEAELRGIGSMVYDLINVDENSASYRKSGFIIVFLGFLLFF